jgi:hypothetical protein
MSGLPVILWAVVLLWSAVILYVIVDVRRVMGRNNKINASLLGREPAMISDRSVLVNRLALVAVLIAGNWAIVRFGTDLLVVFN